MLSVCAKGVFFLCSPFSAGGPFMLTASHFFLLWFREIACLLHTFQIQQPFIFPVSLRIPAVSVLQRGNDIFLIFFLENTIPQNKTFPWVGNQSGNIYTFIPGQWAIWPEMVSFNTWVPCFLFNNLILMVCFWQIMNFRWKGYIWHLIPLTGDRSLWSLQQEREKKGKATVRNKEVTPFKETLVPDGGEG